MIETIAIVEITPSDDTMKERMSIIYNGLLSRGATDPITISTSFNEDGELVLSGRGLLKGVSE
jgi:hypothetical protein